MITTIRQCDLKRTLTIYEKTKTYLIAPTDGTGTPVAMGGDGGGGTTNPAAVASAPPRGGVVNITQTLTDTGERKEMFGFTARRIKTSMVKTAMSLEYKLESIERTRQGTANTAKAKASRDGEDVVTGLVEKAAADVVATATKKQ